MKFLIAAALLALMSAAGVRGDCAIAAPPDSCAEAKQCTKYMTGIDFKGGSTRSIITAGLCTSPPAEVAAATACLTDGAGLGAKAPGTGAYPCSSFAVQSYSFGCEGESYTCWMVFCTGCSRSASA